MVDRLDGEVGARHDKDVLPLPRPPQQRLDALDHDLQHRRPPPRHLPGGLLRADVARCRCLAQLFYEGVKVLGGLGVDVYHNIVLRARQLANQPLQKVARLPLVHEDQERERLTLGWEVVSGQSSEVVVLQTLGLPARKLHDAPPMLPCRHHERIRRAVCRRLFTLLVVELQMVLLVVICDELALAMIGGPLERILELLAELRGVL
mmetsp:Transcript_12263/g.24228  ORF Transcript_12263/g.24228 Transcript_12263/m.24228 type:complete len:206 (+) Transcript_12263:1258-1875(+)